ncbi:MAG TPA: phosphoribosylanthranilate isomerase, partial [Planctomycetaceae bacterium]
AAASAGADAIGMIFCDSPRKITPEQGRSIVEALPPLVAAVGVFVDERPETVIDVARRVGLTAVQLHGDEAPETVAAVAGEVKVIKAIRVRGPQSFAGLDRYDAASAFLFDAYVKGARGGTGHRFNWDLLAGGGRAHRLRKPWILAGGLTPENVEEAISLCRPYGVDASSGVERGPGIKDVAKVEEFIARVRRSDYGEAGTLRPVRGNVCS